MKTLTNDEIIQIVNNCLRSEEAHYCELHCPLFKECLHWYTGEECGSALEQGD
jgi:hypothetical protein